MHVSTEIHNIADLDITELAKGTHPKALKCAACCNAGPSLAWYASSTHLHARSIAYFLCNTCVRKLGHVAEGVPVRLTGISGTSMQDEENDNAAAVTNCQHTSLRESLETRRVFGVTVSTR